MAVKFHFKCSHCTKDNYFDPKKAQTLVPLMERSYDRKLWMNG